MRVIQFNDEYNERFNECANSKILEIARKFTTSATINTRPIRLYDQPRRNILYMVFDYPACGGTKPAIIIGISNACLF